ncbi:FixH family protein [Microbulbifer sp. 2205BS26-8]|uniref:FixH family protein n=1 Tax=Microbulbifer sp. 2205BS26-8 TaxID=3064386 RepID=UPI00273FA95C|nr:FixH family protein [Microbulbifer sp. 2205BS26-8]MDP5210393.1 FixH family protein [Microbulbifer sp. 2205BS26-8]
MKEPTAKPWYREFWAWMVLAPLIAVLVVSSITVSIAVRHADDTVSDTYHKENRMYHFSGAQDQRALALGLAAMVQFQRGAQAVIVELNGNTDYPGQLLLTLSHPAEEDLDQHIVLSQLSVGRYTGTVPTELNSRWYLRLMPELDPQKHRDAQWRLKGEINFDLGEAAPLNPAHQ